MNTESLIVRLKPFQVLFSNWVLFVLLVSTLFVCPFFFGNIPDVIFDVLIISVILLSIFAISSEKSKQVLVWGGISILSVWFTDQIEMVFLNSLLRLIVIIYFISIVFRFIILVSKREKVGSAVIVEAINGYLLMGLGFSFIVNFVTSFYPDVFSFTLPNDGSVSYDPIYFSFVTMTTLGYGDMLPLGQGAKSIALIITLCGQFYLVTIMAFLVGKLLAKKS